MKRISLFALIFSLLILRSIAQVPIIFDTDMGPDYDDVGAIALLHAFADQGKVKILATVSCNTFSETGPTLSVFNTYFKRPDIPIGITRGTFPNKDCQQRWNQYINERYPHALKTNDQAEDAVQLYRRILASQPDQSVTIVTVGFFTNLANLLTSPPDKYSPLDGKQLTKTKVKQLVSMAGEMGPGEKGEYEFNVHVDAKASQKVFAEWPTPVTLSLFEIGEKIYTGLPLSRNPAIRNSPVKDAYDVALKADRNTWGRCSWDQTAVFVAALGAEPYFTIRKMNFTILDDGKSVPSPGDRFSCIMFNDAPGEIAGKIEELMSHQPGTR